MSGSVDSLLTFAPGGQVGARCAGAALGGVGVASWKSRAVAIRAAVWLAWAMGVFWPAVLSEWSLKGSRS
jgi:hypothetical protein